MYMWDWQHVFQIEVRILLEKIFKILELQTFANVFVIGIPVKNDDVNLIFFHPEEYRLLQNAFKDVFKIAKTNHDDDPEKSIILGAPHLHKAYHESLYPKAMREAVQSILNSYDTDDDVVSFCSFPVKKNKHWIITVVQIDMKLLNNHYCLQIKECEYSPMRKHRIDSSFLEAIIYNVLLVSNTELQSPSEGNTHRIADPERILEDAASNLLYSIRLHVNIMGDDLFALSNIISAERYEGAGSRGRMILAKQNHPDVLVKIKFEIPIKMGNYRGIRKLLEVSSNAMALLSDGENIWGLGVPLETYDPAKENLFELRFTEHYTWELVHAENVMLRVKYRQPRLPKERFNIALFRDHVDRLFNVLEVDSDVLVEAVEGAINQHHGTILVITPKASKEAKRLSAQSTPIQPIPLTKDVIFHISCIDGAVLVSPDGTIHAFGVILDGLASENGSSERGARYNSAIRYVDGQNKAGEHCLALIVSEDGYVDLYPLLRPRINRLLIDELLCELERYAGPLKDFNADKAWSAIAKLDKYRFYLLEKDVKRANSAKKINVERIEEYQKKEMVNTGLIPISPPFKDFKTYEEMSLEYYLPNTSSKIVSQKKIEKS